MLEHLLIDAAVGTGSVVLDNLSTYPAVKKYGIESEQSPEIRELMHSKGTGKGLLIAGLKHSYYIGASTILLFGVDYVMSIHDNALNLHHSWLYTISGLKYLAAAHNAFATVGMGKAAKATDLLPDLFVKSLTRLASSFNPTLQFYIGKHKFTFSVFGSYDSAGDSSNGDKK